MINMWRFADSCVPKNYWSGTDLLIFQVNDFVLGKPLKYVWQLKYHLSFLILKFKIGAFLNSLSVITYRDFCFHFLLLGLLHHFFNRCFLTSCVSFCSTDLASWIWLTIVECWFTVNLKSSWLLFWFR